MTNVYHSTSPGLEGLDALTDMIESEILLEDYYDKMSRYFDYEFAKMFSENRWGAHKAGLNGMMKVIIQPNRAISRPERLLLTVYMPSHRLPR